jgi:carboxylesterase type B
MLLLVALAVVAGSVAVCGVTVDTKYGPVEGFTVPLHTGRFVNVFHGIPFAKPPVRDLRWRVRAC